jgi:hypothetical protein
VKATVAKPVDNSCNQRRFRADHGEIRFQHLADCDVILSRDAFRDLRYPRISRAGVYLFN